MFELDSKWLTISLSPGDYARMTGHSERYVRNWQMSKRLRGLPDAKIEMRIAVSDILENCDRIRTTVKTAKERGTDHDVAERS